MGDGVIAAIITGAITFAGMLISSAATGSRFKTLSEYQIKEIRKDIDKLSERVNKHNNLVERMAVVESKIEDMKGQ